MALILVLAFGNTAYNDWVNRTVSADNAGGFLLRQLTWPRWTFSSDESIRNLLATDLKALLVVVLTAVFLGVLAVVPGTGFRGLLGAIIGGWSAFIFAAAFAGLIAAFIAQNATLLSALQSAAGGAVYGLFAGWIIGLVTLAFRR